MVRHVWEADREQINQNRLTSWGRKVYERRRETVERSFADAKQLHGHRYARYRGINRVKAQCLLAAACQNMKKIARLRAVFLRLLALCRYPQRAYDRHQHNYQLFLVVAA